MRVIKKSGSLTVAAIAGTYVVSLGLDLAQAECGNLLGFSIHRTDHTDNTAEYLAGMKCFEATDPGFPAGAEYSTEQHPIQSFQWADYSAKPGHDYTYKVMARKGSPENLTTYAEISVDIKTESPETGDHDVYFNRGLAASQEYVRRFGNKTPDQLAAGRDDDHNPAMTWLSRGLYEALKAVIQSADPVRDKLRIAAYEFSYVPFLKVLRDAIAGGLDIQIVYDGRADAHQAPQKANRQAIIDSGLQAVWKERTQPKDMISHNKFIVRLRDDVPVSVWTGGTNFSRGGIFGHSNVGHLVENPAIASQYYDYWKLLLADPDRASLRKQVEATNPLPSNPPPVGVSPVFSPRKTLDALNLYSAYAMGARQGLMMTFAFGINDVFKTVYATSTAPFRLALLEKKTRPMKKGPKLDAELAAIQRLRNMPENVFAVGNVVGTDKITGWVREKLSNLNHAVNYVHNKFMLIDPLGKDPIVVAGSANFSDASTTDNDENMIVIRGNKRVADIYLGEFMRLWSHHAFRESLQWRKPNDPPKPLKVDDWWADSFGNTERSARRTFFTTVSK